MISDGATMIHNTFCPFKHASRLAQIIRDRAPGGLTANAARLGAAFALAVEKNSKDVRLPVQLQRAMAAEAEAAREARAKVIAAEGEQKASRALREASEVIGDSPAALQLRYLQVLCNDYTPLTERIYSEKIVSKVCEKISKTLEHSLGSQ
ncbi:hypothetical protein NQ318_015612 [Aromia moschata]|uniref:Uncharacterized protein n=1 Tax=Aromia moschata TaxID=1265417 RepID=A0AAV8XAY5_9CUCU|nr:hypothetical protein NQ318_015612 [Aromia moschata]